MQILEGITEINIFAFRIPNSYPNFPSSSTKGTSDYSIILHNVQIIVLRIIILRIFNDP
jgi:hypothetical protein